MSTRRTFLRGAGTVAVTPSPPPREYALKGLERPVVAYGIGGLKS